MQKQFTWPVAVGALTVLATLLVAPDVGGLAHAASKPSKATGPFTYAPAVAGTKTFMGETPDEVTSPVALFAPGGGTIFPTGASSAIAPLRVFGIEKVSNAEGQPLVESINVPLDSALGEQIADAFFFAPDSPTFEPGKRVDVDVTVLNPIVAASDYGDYVVTMKAHVPGIGAGSGTRYHLSLREAQVVDTLAPDVTVVSPVNGSSHVLGEISVEMTATDPMPGSGVATMSATVSSAGNVDNGTKAVSDAVVISEEYTPPQPAGVPVTATGIVIPTGGTGQKGTTLADAFTETAPSGIGTYTLSAKASDGAGNSSISTPVTESTFQVTYSIEFTKQEQSGNLNNQNSAGHFAFTVHRSHGVFMYDKTVVVELVRSTAPSVPVATHTIEGNGINAAVQIDDTTDPANPEYKTHFKRADLNPTPPTGPDQYKVIVSFRDVDGNLVKQAESIIVKF